tara:strand:- start:620 stop:1081 length:462 start_codon:yes stop_codon:yes gene_type:complete
MTGSHNMKITQAISLFLLIAGLSFSALADNRPYKEYGDLKVFFSAFNSSFIQPDVASSYNIVRGKDKGLVNIAVVKNGQMGGLPAVVKGTVSNIFGQQQVLEFAEIREENVVYYLAPFRFDKEDWMTFKIDVSPNSDKATHSLTFQRKFYVDE